MAEIDPWTTRSIEEEADDLFFVEEGDEETKLRKKEAQNEMRNAGMLLVSGSEWKERLRETLIEAYEDAEKGRKILASNEDKIFETVMELSKSTCLVVREKNSKGRLEYYKEKKDYKRLKRAEEGKGGTGTGLLVFIKSELGWLVITNNHVIMDEEEAESAVVRFDHLDDDSIENVPCFKVKQLVSKDIRTDNAKDFKSLDFSVLALESEGTSFLEELPKCHFDELYGQLPLQASTYKDLLRMYGLNFVPMIAFSHPHGLGKRISIGRVPEEWTGPNSPNRPKSHIRHDLPTADGSSGANLLLVPLQPDFKFDMWYASFVHYRHHNAVAWHAIGPKLREDFSKRK